MKCKLACVAAIAVVMMAAVPVSAKSKIMACTEAGMTKADDMIMKMPDGENKTMAMQEMTSAKSSMSQKDMAGCSMHMSKAAKMGMMKSKKM
jgi:Na+-translocating ferredoxin:NAD+ oxidoreductase RnfG subunit